MIYDRIFWEKEPHIPIPDPNLHPNLRSHFRYAVEFLLPMQLYPHLANDQFSPKQIDALFNHPMKLYFFAFVSNYLISKEEKRWHCTNALSSSCILTFININF